MQRKSSGPANEGPPRARHEIAPSVRQLIHDLPVAAAVVDLQGHAWNWNAAAELLFPPPPSTGNAEYPLFSVGTQAWFTHGRAAVLQGGSTAGLEWLIRGMGGTRYRLGVHVSPLRDEEGTPYALLALLQDRTHEERRARSAVRSKRLLRRLLDGMADGLIVHRGGEILYANQRAADLLGAETAADLAGEQLDDFVVMPGDIAASRITDCTRAQLAVPGAPVVELVPSSLMVRKRLATAITLRQPLESEADRLQRNVHALRVAESFLRHGVILLDEVGYVTGWNAGAESVTGYPAAEIIGRDLAALYTGEGLDRDDPARALRSAITQGKYEEEGWKVRRDGSRFWCHLLINALYDRDGGIDSFAVTITDLTQQRAGEEAARRTEDQLRQAQRMEAIGRLAGGIAHDFNNLLTAIQGHAQFLLEELPADHPSSQDALEIRKSADRAASLTRQLLAFSRRQELQPRNIDLNGIIAEMGTLLRRVISENIQLNMSLDVELWTVRADPGQIEQVIMNLVVNARDAMPRGGAITIRTANVELDDAYTGKKLEVSSGPYVVLSVSDTGIGMDAETQKHIFEPFFTTKEAGKGTGLGLATVYGIVKQSGGHVWVYSEPQHGTTFKIYLPRVAATGEVLHRPPRFRDVARDGETVLVVEDEPAVRTLARRVLEQRGYHVLEAGTGEEAVRVASGNDGPIHLLLSDVVVPDMNGRIIAEHIMPTREETRVLFMSGYTDEDVRQHGVLDAEAPFLEKPFTPEGLARKVREVLDGE